MSFYTKFQDVETTVTSSSTANLLAITDPVLGYSSALKRAGAIPVGTISSYWAISSTSSSTATLLPNNGLSIITSATPVTWQLADPAQRGQCIAIFNSSSTSTANNVSTVTATIQSTDSSSAITFGFSKSGAYIEAVALSTSVWLVTGRSAAGILST